MSDGLTFARTLEVRVLNLLRFEQTRDQVMPYLDVRHLSKEGVVLFKTMQYLLKHRVKEIGLGTLRDAAKVQFPNEQHEGMPELLAAFKKHDKDKDNPEAVQAVLQGFLRYTKAIGLYQKLGAVVAQGPPTDEQLQELASEAQKALPPPDKPMVPATLTDVERILEKQKGIGTGIASVDEQIGGIRTGELGMIAGVPKRGKTTLLVNIACAELKRGKPVAYISVKDIDFDGLRVRFASCLSGLPFRKENIPEIQKRVKDAFANLYILDLTDRSARLADIQQGIVKAKEIRPDMRLVMIDRAESIISPTKSDSPRFETKRIFEELRSYAKKYEVGMWVDTYSDSRTYQAKRVTMAMASEDKVWKPGIIDLWIGVGAEDEEPDTLWLTMEGRRNIKDDMAAIAIDKRTFRIEDLGG